LDSDPDCVYLDRTLKKPIELKVIKEAPVFSDKEGSHRLGTLKADQTVHLEAITDKIYRVRGQGTRDGIAGWVAPWAFSSKDPDFVAHFKQLYERQIQVQALIEAKKVAVGMTPDEVSQSLGKPTKTSLRKTDKGQSGRWEFIEYDQVKNYVTRIDPTTGAAYRQLASVTQVEKSRVAVEFENDVVTAVEESEDHQGGNVRIIVPPVIFGW
jgi:outer membrane protein assembly factor BamE (lipoprotein component of BamABCDE complex)